MARQQETTYEEIQKCRYYPDCEIHLGLIPNRTFKPETIREIRSIWDEGERTAYDIAREFHCDATVIENIGKRKTYRNIKE